MPVFSLSDQELIFPPVALAEPDGLLAAGGDLRMERLLLAYRSGIFPWFSHYPILWWSPDPRFVLFPAELKVSHSMKQLLRRNTFEITTNQDFEQVIRQCGAVRREGQDGTWITEDMIGAYLKLFAAGYAESIECWQNGQLVGGLYGLRMGNCFFGESMFSKVSNASKAAFITFIQANMDLAVIDCQVHTPHLASLGARFISRVAFLNILQQHI